MEAVGGRVEGEGGSASGQESGEKGGGEERRQGVAGQDRWFFTLLLCKLLSG